MDDAARTVSPVRRLLSGRFGRFGSATRGLRGRLFRKYVLLLVGLVSLVLLVNAGLHFWFSYSEEETAAYRLQQEKARSAARRIEEFVDEIENQLGWTTAPQWAAAPLEQRQFDYVRLLRQEPAITELIQLDSRGKEQLRVSRLAMDVVGSGKDYSQEPSFTEAKKHRVWFSPVYFRKESEPYSTLAMAQAGPNAGVTIAEVNLKLIWDVIGGMKIGRGGYAYVIDRNGRLIAHPDISLVLRDPDLEGLPQVAAARAATQTHQFAPPAMVAKNLNGETVLTAHAAIVPLGWTVFVELPLREALAPLYASMMQSAALLAVALGLAALAALFLARRMVGPIRLLQAGAARIGAGELDRRIDIHTGDELEELAGEFNRMAGDLQKSYADLEQKVEDRTAELKEALDQQTATAEVLGVINSSPGDLAPVFDAMLEKATWLCEASFGTLWTYDGDCMHPVAIRGSSPQYTEFLKRGLHRPSPVQRRLIRGEGVVQVADVAAGEGYRSGDPLARALVELGGIRSLVAVPLRKEDAVLGAVSVYRQEVRPFTDKQIALLQNFAAQAVIAMENARLLTETREALEQQTATAEILQVINSSPGDLAPVFDAILEKAHSLCGLAFSCLQLYDGGKFRAGAERSVPGPLAEQLHQPTEPPPEAPSGRLLRGERFVQLADMAEWARQHPDDARAQAAVEHGLRTLLMVPLRKDADLLGYIAAFRRQVRPFSRKEIALLQSFAAQAVIAMENARLLRETREALEQQTATAEVLQVINSSPGDLAPVFDAMLEKAMRLCEAAFGELWIYDGHWFEMMASRGMSAEFAEFLRGRHRMSPETAHGRVLAGEDVVHIHDVTGTELYRSGDPHRTKAVELGGVRSLLAVSLRRDEKLLGMLNIYRQEVRPFSNKQIALLQNFAAQAVIAMENARLLTETREALEQQTATAEVLQVINSSPGDLAPVFDAMLEKAMRLCGAAFGVFATYDEVHYRVVATHGVPAGLAEFVRQPVRIDPGSMPDRLRRGEDTIQVADIITLGSELRTPGLVAMIELGNARTAVWVALRKDGVAQGFFGVYRQEVRPFSDKQIALLQNFAAQAVIAMENARLITETREALEQQTATAEVLQVVNSSPGNLAPVFEAMLDKALRLCEAAFGLLHSYDGERFRALAVGGISGTEAEPLREWVPDPGSALQQIVDGDRVVHIPDVIDTVAYRSGVASRLKLVQLTGARTALWVALRKDDGLLGVFVIYRKEIRPFSEKQIALVQNFAAQAVIAMENARLITETREALEQQTATAEVLGVINSSPGDLAPVFDAILEKAHALCGVTSGALEIWDGEHIRALATRGLPASFEELVHQGYKPGPNDPQQQLLDGARFVHILDQAAIDEPTHQKAVELGGFRTFLAVALRKDNTLLGRIVAARQEVRPFSEKELALLENFAAQAVIAIENARLINETREALEQQTATAEVLQVINSSPGDLAPVFDAILEKTLALCSAAFGDLSICAGEQFLAVATRGFPTALIDFYRNPFTPDPKSYFGQLVNGEDVLHIADMAAEFSSAPGSPLSRAGVERGRALVELGNARTGLFLALRKDDALLGAMRIFRQEVRPFTDKQIALVENFAAQAVIAMENARLITETREALEQQTATAEVLQVINSSPGELAPVFDSILEKAHSLCGAAKGALVTYDGDRFRGVATRGLSEPYAALVRAQRDNPPGSPPDRLLQGESLVHVRDFGSLPFSIPRAAAELEGARTVLFVPLRKDSGLLGYITAYRQEVRPFSDKQIALLQNFAAQAVIAMENARLITETREALEQQTATAEVLGVINSSPGDLAPVFDAMLEKAMRLCDAAFGGMWTFDQDRYVAVALRGVPKAYAEFLANATMSPGPDTAPYRLRHSEPVVHNLDLAAEEAYRAGDPQRRALVDLGGARSALQVSLRKDDDVLGVITIYRQEVKPFSEKQIALLENFAVQAVIAMENARLITELRQRTHDLQESLEYQTASGDVLKVISQSGRELEPLLDTLVETAARICRADSGFVFRLQGGLCKMVAAFGIPAEYKEFQERNPIAPGRGTLAGRTVVERRAVHIEDAATDPEYIRVQAVRLGRQRTMLGVPLIREDALIGVITLARSYVDPFTEKQIGLVTTFADQAVIAIENARLFNELRERTAELGRSVEELKLLNDVAQAVSSTLDLRSVLSTILTASLGVTWANAGAIFRYSRAERAFRLVEAAGWDETLLRSVRELRIAETETAMGEAATRRAPVQLPDLAQRASYPLRDITLAAGFRSALIVPLVGGEPILGTIILMRQDAGEFPPETVRLMQTLASQSVLAIQNARLFREIADKSEQLALASQHKSQFLANMSHELRTPLNAILGYAELLVDGIYGVLPERPRGVLERVQNNGKHLLALINDVLDLAKIEAGQLALTLEDYNLPEVVKSVVTATEPLAASKGLKFTAAVAENMPMAHGDARRVSQVLLNLVGNAIKFTDAGEVEIRAAAERGQFVLTVRDTGPGIAEADHERIFGEFQQIDNSSTRQRGGTGLGLAISKRMVEMQGGTISVESELGQGSTFRVVLPVHVDEVLEAA